MTINLYHGSSIEVRRPEILPRLRALDFGAGFYLTSNKAQAIHWAKLVARRRSATQAILNCYAFDKEKIPSLNILQFHEAGKAWLEFIVANRRMQSVAAYDLIIRPLSKLSHFKIADSSN